MSKVNKNIRPSKIVGAVVLAPSATSTATTTLAQTATSARTQTLQDATDTFVYRATTDTLTHKTIIDSTNILLSYWKKSGFIVVDPVNGNNATAAVGGLPYQTIAAALAAASSGNCVHLAPGTYNESNLSPPAGVTIRGTDVNTTNISATLTASGTIINMNNNVRIEDVTITVASSTSGITISCVTFAGTSAANAKLRTAVVVASSTATGAVNVYALYVTGAGVPSSLASSCVRACTINATASAAASGNVRAVYITGASSMNLQEINMDATGAGTCSLVSIETANASAVVNILRGTLDSTTADYLQTSGTINLYSTTSTIGGEIIAGKVMISNTSVPAAGYVLQATSATAATWQPLVSAASSFTLLIESYATGTNGANSTANTWVQRVLNTVVYTQSWLSLASNQFTLAAGTYTIEARANATNAVNGTQARIKNVTSTTYVYGSCAYLNSGLLGTGATTTVHSNISQFVTIASNTVFQIEQWTGVTTTNAFGLATGATGATEIYLMVEITKLA